MRLRNGIIGAVACMTVLGGAGAATLLAGGNATPPRPATLISASPAILTASSTSSPAASIPSTTPTDACSPLRDDGGWPPFVDGRPPHLDAGDAAADYLWHDQTGWHLRITHQNDHHQAWSGVITTTGTFSDADAVKLENNDFFKVGPDKHTISFRFNNYGGIDGLDFSTHCAEGLHFGFRADGTPVNPTEVVIGHGDRNPASVPFEIRRTEG